MALLTYTLFAYAQTIARRLKEKHNLRDL